VNAEDIIRECDPVEVADIAATLLRWLLFNNKRWRLQRHHDGTFTLRERTQDCWGHSLTRDIPINGPVDLAPSLRVVD